MLQNVFIIFNEQDLIDAFKKHVMNFLSLYDQLLLFLGLFIATHAVVETK
jgi:hypothetical protein